MREEAERTGPGWLVTLLGASLLLAAGFAVGVVVGAAREEPELWLRHVSGETDSVTPDAAPGGPVPPASTLPSVEAAAPAAAQPGAEVPKTPEPAAATAHERVVPPPAAPLPARNLDPLPLGAKPKAPPAGAVTAPPPMATRYAVQVGAFSESAQADGLARKLRKRGLPVQIIPGTGGKDARWRVRVGPLGSREEADRVAAKLRDEKLPTWILAEAR